MAIRMGSAETDLRPHIVAQLPEGFDPTTDDITSWLARFDIFVIISLVDGDHKGFYLLNSLSSIVYRALAAFVKLQEITSLSYKDLKLKLTEIYGTKRFFSLKGIIFFILKRNQEVIRSLLH